MIFYPQSLTLYSIVLHLFFPSLIIGNPSDCWNPNTLESLDVSNKGDEGLSKFNLMVKCLMKDRNESPGVDWTQLQNGEFPPVQSPERAPEWNSPNTRSNLNRPSRPNENSQPKPGVHPEDWNKNEVSYDRKSLEEEPPPVWGQPTNKRKNRRRNEETNKKKKKLEEPSANEPPWKQEESGEEREIFSAPEDENLGKEYISLDYTDETSAISLHRKYGYAVMALSVLVLAILMVTTIFCCNSSNSTMAQSGVGTSGLSQLDNYSLYSYKVGLPNTESLRSGTMRSNVRTDTLRSTGTNYRASPQYRVSDIDPDFSRRYKNDEEHY